MTTYGENLVEKLANKLPDDYYTFPEPTIISKRFSALRNPDFVIVGAKLGVVVLEVKDWKTIRRIDHDVFEIQRDNGEIATETNPVKTAEKYSYNLVERLQALDELMHRHRGKLKLKFPWIYAAVLPHIEYENKIMREAEQKHIWDSGQVLYKKDLTPENFEQALINISRPYSLSEPLKESVLSAIYAVLKPEVRITDMNGQVTGIPNMLQNNTIEESPKLTSKLLPIKKLNAAQAVSDAMEIADETKNTSARLIRGVAGSGKSLVLARRAQFLAEQNPNWCILVLAFNVDLVADLKRRIPGAQNLEVINFHKLCSRILGKTWRSPSDTAGWLTSHINDTLIQNNFTSEFVAEEIEWRKEVGLFDNTEYLAAERKGRGSALPENRRMILNQMFNKYIEAQHSQGFIDWSDVPYKTLAALQNGHYLQHFYDVILVDEAQDFAPSWVKVITELLKPECLLFMCDDPTQSIFRSYSWKEKGVLVQGRTRHLRVPFRSTREITLAAHSLISDNYQTNQSDEIVSPDFDTYELPSGGIPKLVKCRHLTDEIRFVEESALNLISSDTKANQIAVLCHNKSMVKQWDHLRTKGIYVEHFRKMKGLEFEVVFVPQLQSSFISSGDDLENDFYEKKCRSIFTAMTRARQNLILTYHGVFPSQLAPIEPFVETLIM